MKFGVIPDEKFSFNFIESISKPYTPEMCEYWIYKKTQSKNLSTITISELFLLPFVLDS